MKSFASFLFVFISLHAFTQSPAEAELAIRAGVALHDKGDYKGAIAKYEEALGHDAGNLQALAEMAYSFSSLQMYEEAIAICQRAIDNNAGDEDLANVYTTYGSALDLLKRSDEAISVYDEGIALFPDVHQLHFNKGVTQAGLMLYDDALASFERAVVIHPGHASSHNAISAIQRANKKKIPALLAAARFLVIEPEGKRAAGNLENVQTIMGGNVEKTGKKSVTISLDAGLFGDTTATGEPNENSFSSIEMIMSLTSALDYDKQYKNETEVERFQRKFDVVCSSLAEGQEKNHGFYWSYYVPYFIEMKEKGMLETFAYLAFASSGDSKVDKWIGKSKTQIADFYAWSKEYEWAK